MDSKQVQFVLKSVGLNVAKDGDPILVREELVLSLMNVTLQCLGALRLLVVESEKMRIAADCCDIDGTFLNDGKAERLRRAAFRTAVNYFGHHIMVGEELDPLEPAKELLESFPGPTKDSYGTPAWFLLHWSLLAFDFPADSPITNFATVAAPVASNSYSVWGSRLLPIEGSSTIFEESDDDSRAESASQTEQSKRMRRTESTEQLEEKTDVLSRRERSVSIEFSEAERSPTFRSRRNSKKTVPSSRRRSIVEVQEKVLTIRNILEHYPECVVEIDGKGQHYLAYAAKTNCIELLENLKDHNKSCCKYKDGMGKLPIHYYSYGSETVEQLLSVAGGMKQSLADVFSKHKDNLDNLPIHFAAAGSSHMDVMNEILFAHPDGVKAKNKEGKLPLHMAAAGNDARKVRALLAAYPHAASKTDNNGWLPIMHAAFSSKSVEVLRVLHEAYPEGISKPQVAGRVPLHYAAVNCLSLKTMKYLIEEYPDAAKTFDNNRRLPLHNLIARCKHMTPARLRCLRLLLEVYPHAASMAGKDGRTPLDLARRDRHGDLVLRLLLRADPSQDPEALGELGFKASRAKFKGKYDENDDAPEQRSSRRGSRRYSDSRATESNRSEYSDYSSDYSQEESESRTRTRSDSRSFDRSDSITMNSNYEDSQTAYTKDSRMSDSAYSSRSGTYTHAESTFYDGSEYTSERGYSAGTSRTSNK